jgi:hypothetical protein
MSNVYPLHREHNLISHILRVGHTGHRVFEDLSAAGQMPLRRAVFDASHSQRQHDLIAALASSGVEIVLDTKSAELAYEIGMHSRARDLPWALSERIQRPDDWTGVPGRARAEQIAEFAQVIKADAVLAPTHFIDSARSPWLATDVMAARLLRDALDALGSKDIRVDYCLTAPISPLRDQAQIDLVARAIADTPDGNLWLRLSGFGMTGSAAALRRYIEFAWRLASLGKPIIADNVGGNAALSLAGFGAVGGICQGAAERDSFNVSSWRSRPTGGRGPQKRIYAPALDLFLPKKTAETFLDRRYARTLILCKDQSCCRDAEDMIVNAKRHAIIQSNQQISNLSRRPPLKRVDFLLTEVLPETGRTLRKARRIKFEDEKLTARLQALADRSERMLHVLEDLHSSVEITPIPKTPISTVKKVEQAG